MIDLPPYLPHQAVEISSVAGLSASATPTAPRTVCDIRMRLWCITRFDGKVELSGSGRFRTWTLTDRLYMQKGPLEIIEGTDCDGDEAAPREKYNRVEKLGTGESYRVVEFSLTAKEACSLKFRFPAVLSEPNSVYEQTMRYGILVCSKNTCSSELGHFIKPSSSRRHNK